MASQLISGDLISDRYASALYDLASASKEVDWVLKDLETLKKIILENNDLKLLVKSPLIASNDKFKILEKIMTRQQTNKLTYIFLKVISKNKRFSSLPSIILQFININAKKRGEVSADITSADELSDSQKKSIKDQLSKILGEKLLLNFLVDRKIIGGLIVKVGSKMIDSSMANKINKLNIVMKGA